MELEANNQSSSEGNTSFFKTLFNGLNAIIGVGILSMPYALASGGWLTLILLVAISSASFYAGILTKRCMDMNPNKIKTYAHIGEYAYGKIGKNIVSTVLFADMYLVLTGYLILEGDNLHNLYPNINIHLYGINIGGKESFVMIIALIVLPTIWLQDLRILAYISTTGVLSGFVILVSVFWVGCFGGLGFTNEGKVLNWKGIPIGMSLYMFSFSANPVFPVLYTSMQNKHHFSKVLLIGFICATLCYTSMAIMGYLMFGSTIQSQITLNLPTHKLSSKIAIYTAWITPLSKFALMMEPIASTAETWFPKYQKNTSRSFKILLRTTLLVTQVIVAITIPFFGSLMSLVGALLSATASIAVPCLCYLKISKNNGKLIEKMFIWVVVVFSVLIVVLGTYTSLRSIIRDTIRHHSH